MHIKDPKDTVVDQHHTSERAVMLASDFNKTKFELPHFILEPHISALFMSLSCPGYLPWMSVEPRKRGNFENILEEKLRKEPVLFSYRINRTLLETTLQTIPKNHKAHV